MNRGILIFVAIAVLSSTASYALEPELIWAGGALRLSDESAPAYMGEAFVSLGAVDDMYLFTDPVIFIKESELGLNLGIGARTPILARQAIAGYNVFFDYTGDKSHKRLGAGAELFHSYFSAHANIYLPISDEHRGEEALPGLDLTFGIPLPNASFITLWPGVYYYNGSDRSDMKGMSFAIEVKPMKILAVTLGGRNDAIESGRNNRGEIFFKAAVTVPMERLGQDLFKFERGTYPVNVNSRLDNRVVREPFITYEHSVQ